MRTRLDIDDDVWQAAKELAVTQRTTLGKIISDLARKGLRQTGASRSRKMRNGFPVLPSETEIIPINYIKHLHD